MVPDETKTNFDRAAYDRCNTWIMFCFITIRHNWRDQLVAGNRMDATTNITAIRDDVIKWKHCLRYWPLVRGIHRSPVNSPHKGQWRVALVFSLICVRINGWVNNGEAGDLRRHRAHYDVIVMNWIMFRILVTLANAKITMSDIFVKGCAPLN